MMQPLLVSVVVPTHNRANLIARALASIDRQTHRPIEIIVVDDCSTDETLAVVESFPLSVPCRIVRHSEKRGGAAARNSGIFHSRGEFIAFLDSDDAFLPNKIKRDVAALIAAGPGCGLAHCGWLGASAGGRMNTCVRSYPREDTAVAILRSNFVGATAAATVRRTALQAVGGFDEEMPSCQDWDLFIRLAKITQFTCVAEPGFIQCDHPGERITGNQRQRGAGLARIYRKHLRHFVRNDPDGRRQFMRYMGDVAYRSGRIKSAHRLLLRSRRQSLRAFALDRGAFLARIGAPPALYSRLVLGVRQLQMLKGLMLMSASGRREFLAEFREAVAVPARTANCSTDDQSLAGRQEADFGQAFRPQPPGA